MDKDRVAPGAIVVGVDGSQHAKRALHWAADQAVLEGRPLVVVNAAGEGDLRSATWVGVEGPSFQLPDMLQSARAVCELATFSIAQLHPRLKIVALPRLGDPRHVLVDLSRTAHLLVIGSRGRGTLRSMVLGSVSVNVAKHAHCPVVVTRPGGHGQVRDGVLVGADGTTESLPVIEFAFRQASLRGAPLTVMHTSYDLAAEATDVSDVTRLHTADTEELHLLLAESVAGLQEKFPDVHVSLELGFGLADECLTRGSRPRDLIVVGRHPSHLLTTLLSGSVSTGVLERAHCTVAVVPEADHAPA